MSECCVTTSPKITIKPNSCSKNTVQASRSDSSVGIGCVPSTPRDLVGAGLLVSMYYYDSTIGQTVFQGPDRNANTLQNASLETSLVLVNGVVLDNDQYTLTEVTLTLNDGCLTSDDIVSVIVFREPAEAEDSVGQGQITTVDVLTIPPGSDSTRPINLPDNLELVTTQFDANWFLNDRIDELDLKVDGINVSVDLSDYSTTIEMVAADDTTLADAKAYTDNEIAAIPPAGNVDLSSYALTTYVDDQDSKLQTQIDSLSTSGGYNDAWIQIAIDAGDASTLVDAKAYTDGEIAAIPPTDLSSYATKKELTDGDEKALADSKKYGDDKFVTNTGGDDMQGPLHIKNNGSDTRATNRVTTLGVFSNSEGSSLRLGTTRDRIYIGHNDTSINGPLKVDELQEKTTGGGISLTNRTTIAQPEGTNKDGFSVLGKTDAGDNNKLLSVYHNLDGIDAVNYHGKQDSNTNLRQSVMYRFRLILCNRVLTT